MRRALFAREFRTALVPNLITVGAILGTLVAVERIYGLRLDEAEEVRSSIDIVLLAGLVGSGFISGERCFPSALKEHRLFFLASLPVSRSGTWLGIVSARLLAALVSLILAIAIRRPLLPLWINEDLRRMGSLPFTSLLFLIYVLFFSAGALFALLFRKTLFSYIAGGLLLGALLVEALLASSYPQVSPRLLHLETIPEVFNSEWRPNGFLAAFLSLLLLSSLFLSWRIFTRGEIGNAKRRIRNHILFGITATTYLGLIFCVASSTKLVSFRNIWRDAFASSRMMSFYYRVSPDGRHMLVFEESASSPFILRVNIIDTETGHLSGQSVYGGVSWAFWSKSGDVLNLLRLKNSPLDRWGYLSSGAVEWVRLSPMAKEMSTLRLKGIESVKVLEGGRALVVLRERSTGRVLLLDGASGRSSEVVQGPLDGEVAIRATGPVALVYFDNTLLPKKAWVVDSLVREVRVRSPLSLSEGAYVIGGEVFVSYAQAQAELRRKFIAPLTKGGKTIAGNFLIPMPSDNPLWILASEQPVFFLGEGTPYEGVLWARSTAPQKQWEQLPRVVSKIALQFFNFLGFADSVLVTGVFLTEESDSLGVFVYDSLHGAILAPEKCRRGEEASVSAGRVTGLSGILIILNCSAEQSRGRDIFFEHIPGSEEVRAIKTTPTKPLYLRPLYLDQKGRKVGLSYRREIWRSSPGNKDLRLWPLRTRG